MSVAGLIFSNIHDSSLPELTARRSIASVPFGCRYRLIDFPLSNMVNSGISKIGIVTHNNYASLMDHIGTGKDWDLARRSGGIKILPPFITEFENPMARRQGANPFDALMSVRNFISRCTEDEIVFSYSDIICNIDLSDVLKAHKAKGAEVTLITYRYDPSQYKNSGELYAVASNDDGTVSAISHYGRRLGEQNICTDMAVFNREALLDMIDSMACDGYSDFYLDVLGRYVAKGAVYAYGFEGVFMRISSMEGYFGASMKLLSAEARNELFGNKERPIHTKVRNSSPTLYKEGSKVKNSYIADGCVIEGEVENSILFRGVKVGRGTVIKNSILLQDTNVGENVKLGCVITDKDVKIRDGRELSGHTTMPFFISKGTTV